jgi:hypothetical protein
MGDAIGNMGLHKSRWLRHREKRSCATTKRHRATTSQGNFLRIQALEA